MRRILGFVVASALAVAGMSTPASAAARVRPRGIDVSHWQGTIDWNAVEGAGMSFVFAKATEGKTFDDPNYAGYRSGAKAQGMYFGAYHFARPDSSTDDAILEAAHFATVAGPKSGELIPVLDLEDSGGLSTTKLTAWTFDWLAEVEDRTGVKAMIYTSPSFWETYMGDTEAFAQAGYKLLWIANWFVPWPTVPGHRWGGYGWTFWQRSDCATVPGITGCVDADLYKFDDFTQVLIS